MRNETLFDKVKAFCDNTGGFPKYEYGSDFNLMKLNLIDEEVNEFFDQLEKETPNSPPKQHQDVLKEMCDVVYVLLGYAYYRGWDFDTAFNRVHKSNLSKIPEDGVIKYREDGKVMKPDTYQPANLEGLV